MEAIEELYEKIINKNLLVRRINVVANNLINEKEQKQEKQNEQISLFIDYKKQEQEKAKEQIERKKENNLQHAIIDIKKKYGKNAIIKGMNLEEYGTTIERNAQIGGHKEQEETMENYQDIINLPHHTSTKHPKLTPEQRAAQFAPFAALTGYEDKIEETIKQSEDKYQKNI